MNEETRQRLLAQLQQRQGLPAPADSGSGLGEVAWNMLNAIQPVQALEDLASGDSTREFDYPELPPTIGAEATPANPAAFQGMMGFARDDAGKADIYSSVFPDDPVTFDRFGNAIVEHNGQMYYLDRPGVSPQDAADIGTGIISEVAGVMPFTRLGGALLGGAGRVAGAGAGAGAGSLGQDAVADIAGSEQGYDALNALVATGFGVAGEAGAALTGPALQGLGRAFRGQADTVTPPQFGSGVAELRADPSDRFGAIATEMVQSTPGQRVTTAQNLPSPIPLSRADVSPGNPRVQREEELFAGGGMGQPAADVMQQFRQGQTQAVASNFDLMQGRLGGAVDREAPGAGMGMMQQRLLSDIEASNQGINQAYDAARSAGREATLSEDGLYMLADDFVRIIDENAYDIGQMPRLTRRLEDLQTIMRTGELQPGPMAGAASPETVAAQINQMEQWRRRLSDDIIDLRGPTGNPTERRALIQMIQQYDQFMGQALDNALVQGNQEAIDLWRNAVGLRRGHFEQYERDDLIRRITETTRDAEGNMVPVMTPQQSLNLLFGTNSLATSRFSNSVPALRQLRTMYGAQSPEWNALREEAFVRLAPVRGNVNDPSPAFTAFVRNFDRSMREAPEMMSTLFSRGELDVMRDLRDTIELITTRTPGVVNRSGSGHLVLQAMGRFFGSGVVGSAVQSGLNRGFGWLINGMRGQRARDLVGQPVPSAGPILPRGMGGLVGGGAANVLGADPILQGMGLPIPAAP